MPAGALLRHEITIDFGGSNELTVEFRPFSWPLSDWEILRLVGDQETGWRDLVDSAMIKLEALFNGAHGTVEQGLKGLVVQYVEGTGRAPFVIVDWRKNAGVFVFAPNDGLQREEIHGAAGDGIGRFTATLAFVRMRPAIYHHTGIPSAQAFGLTTISTP